MNNPDYRSEQWYRRAHGPLLAILVVVSVGLSALPISSYLSLLGLDLLLPINAQEEETALDPNISLVVIDEVTHRTPPFSETPQVAWTPYLAEAINLVEGAGAASMGLDIIFPKTLSDPDLLPGFDRSFLSAIFNAGRSGKLILGETRLSNETIAPYEGQIQAIGGRQNVFPLQFTPDLDGVVRRYPSHLSLENGGRIHSFANELASRSEKVPSEESFILDFNHPDLIPAYRLNDLLDCSNNPSQLETLFKGRIVLFGVMLDVEDRHMATNRFVGGNQPQVQSLSCAGKASASVAQIDRQSVPGVFIHAVAVQTILNGSAPKPLSNGTASLLLAISILVLGFSFLRLPPLIGFIVVVGVIALLWLGAAIALEQSIVFPYLMWSLLFTLSYILLTTYRVFFENQEKRWIRHAFRHYLSPALVDQLAEDPSTLKLGGERRHVAILFLDLAGFTKASEKLADHPEELVSELNKYLATMSDIIEARGGYVDKFIGDAIMAVWGAPVATTAPEREAALAALECQKAIAKINEGQKKPFISAMRIGLNAGQVVVGNMGSEHRFNYTAVGDAVNMAARLETANKNYNTAILAGEDFVRALGDEFLVREVDYATLPGKSTKLHMFEVQGLKGDAGSGGNG